MSSKNRPKEVQYSDDRIKNLVESWTTTQGWKLQDFPRFLKLVKIHTPVRLFRYFGDNTFTFMCEEEGTGACYIIKLTTGNPIDCPSTIMVKRTVESLVYETNVKLKNDDKPKVRLCEITHYTSTGYTTFFLYHNIPYLVKFKDQEEEISISKLTNKWSYKNKDIEISFDMVKRHYAIGLHCDESKLDDIDLVTTIQAVQEKVAKLKDLKLWSTA